MGKLSDKLNAGKNTGKENFANGSKDSMNNSRYVFFDKTADAKFQAFGKDLEEVFSNSLEAMISLTYDITEIQELSNQEFYSQEREIFVEGETIESLLYNFLEESIFLLGAESFIGLVSEILIEEDADGKFTLTATFIGTQTLNINSVGPEVKAVTYNEMYVRYEKGKYVAQVVVDI